MQLDHLTEMEAVDGKCNCHSVEMRTPEQGPEKERPVMDAFDTTDAQLYPLLFACYYLDAFSIPTSSCYLYR